MIGPLEFTWEFYNFCLKSNIETFDEICAKCIHLSGASPDPHFSYPSIEKIMFKIIFNYFVEEKNVYDNSLPSLRANFASNLSCSVVILRTAKVNKPQNSDLLKIDEWIDWLKNWSNFLNEACRLDSLIHYETLVFTNAWHTPKVTKCCQPGFLSSSKIHNKIVLDFDF